MEFNSWALALVLGKWLLYLSQAAAVGGIGTALWIGWRDAAAGRQSAHRATSGPLVVACLLGLALSAGYFLLQVGAFADAGLAGLLDRDMIVLLWQTPVGTATAARTAGIAVLLLALITGRVHQRLVATGCYLVGLAATGLSFSLVGHSVEAGTGTRVLASLHGVAALWWAGSLYPLWQACRHQPPLQLHAIMHGFGQQASAVVLVLVVAGVLLILNLVGSVSALLTTGYGLSLCFKLVMVTALLLLAARHKWRLVPILASQASVATLRRSIALEALIAAAILLTTALLSTVLGPNGQG